MEFNLGAPVTRTTVLGGVFLCMDCGSDTSITDEYYMLKDFVWLKANPKSRGMLCLSCVEKRLGRPITRKDFKLDVPVNEMSRSEEVQRRLNTYD